MDIKAKLRPFYVAKMLYEQTDEDHYLTIAQIMEQLEKDYGISTSRGTVGDDIKALQELGVEIEVVPSTQKRFSLIGRRFDLPELKTLIDAVESARFIPKEKSAALVEKLGSLTSQHNTEKLVRNVDVENRIKADNEKIYYIMEALNDALHHGGVERRNQYQQEGVVPVFHLQCPEGAETEVRWLHLCIQPL